MRQEALRPLVLHLVRAIAEVPEVDRAVWLEELTQKLKEHRLKGEEYMVFMVLNNLPVAERLAGRPEPKPRRPVTPLRSAS